MNIAIICAGGNGERMRIKENKIFLKLNGRPLIYYTLKTFADYGKIDGMVVTVREQDIARLKRIISRNRIPKVLSVLEADSTRQNSTYKVLEKLQRMNVPDDSYVLIHNAVNPLVKHAELDACMEAAHRYGASLLGYEATDTVKVVNEDQLIDHTPDRNRVWIAQIPQIIRYDIALKAFGHAHAAGMVATDDTTLVEAIHGRVKFVGCSRENFKITYPQDMVLASKIHSKRIRENKVWYA
jgi:2-C-methyl-D-erythritol 4-phosphate cytidylyltransferase